MASQQRGEKPKGDTMNTLFVVIMWLSFYYLFFHPLSEVEWTSYVRDRIYREYADGYEGGD